MTAVNTGYGAAGSLLSEAQILGNRGLSYGGQDTLALGIGAYDAYVLDFATPAAESPTTIATKALILKDDSVGTKLGKGQFLFKAETSGAASGHRIEPPSVGGPADPTLHGAVLTVYNTAGTTTDAVSYHLPASGWVVLEKGGFAFAGGKDSIGQPVASVTIKTDALALKAGGLAWGYSLDEGAQGRVGMLLRLRSGAGWCSDAPAKQSGSPPSSEKNDRVGKFLAAKESPAPATCVPVGA